MSYKDHSGEAKKKKPKVHSFYFFHFLLVLYFHLFVFWFVCFCFVCCFLAVVKIITYFPKTTRIELCLVLFIISILLVFTNGITDYFVLNLKILI